MSKKLKTQKGSTTELSEIQNVEIKTSKKETRQAAADQAAADQAAEQQRQEAEQQRQEAEQQRQIQEAERAAEQQRQEAEQQRQAAEQQRQAQSQPVVTVMKRQNAMDTINGKIVAEINSIAEKLVGDISVEELQRIQLRINKLKTTINSEQSRISLFFEEYIINIEALEKILIVKMLEKNPPRPIIEMAKNLKDQLAKMKTFFDNIEISNPILIQLKTEIATEILTYNPQPSIDVNQDQIKAMLFYRFFKNLSSGNETVEGLDIEIIKYIYYIIDLYRSDPDRDDIIRGDIDYHKFVYYLARNINPKWWGDYPLFVREFINTGLGKTQANLAGEDEEEDRIIMTKDKLYNILFSNFIYINIAALVFPFWPIKASSLIPVFIGTGPKASDANCLNFKILEIDKETNPEIKLFAPITSSSNNKELAVRKFLKPGGVILQINLLPGCSYMCVSEASSDEAETFVLPGTYMFFEKIHVVQNGKTYDIYIFNQIDEIIVNPGDIMQKWDAAKSETYSYAIKSLDPYKDVEGERAGMPRLNTHDILKAAFLQKRGGSKRKTRRRRTNKKRQYKTRRTRRRSNKKRRTNKRRRQYKTKRRRI
jgi:hypothetical protein